MLSSLLKEPNGILESVYRPDSKTVSHGSIEHLHHQSLTERCRRS